MIILADESVEAQIVLSLRADGYRVHYVAEMHPGLSDEQVLSLANARNAILLTEDKDFGELVFRLNRIARGVILVRMAGLSSERKAAIVSRAIKRSRAKLVRAFSLITPSAIRIRSGMFDT